MCGFAGALERRGAPGADLPAMVGALRHRGPDGEGAVTVHLPGGGRLVLGHRRLAVVDPRPEGLQPMGDPTRPVWLVFNGEVYNFPALRRELAALGETFRTRTDTEVVLKALIRWGSAAVPRFRGMFAFACWDGRRGRLLLARDRLGLKPLYVARLGDGSFLFASELRALMRSGRIPPRLDPLGVETYLWNGFPVAPRTLVAGVRQLLPGTFLELDGVGRVRRAARYGELPLEAEGPRPTAAALRDAFSEAVRLRRVADVPVGVFLSGGLDSSAVAATLAAAGTPVASFSVGFPEREYDETRYAAAVAAHARHPHRVVRLTRREFLGFWEEALAAADQPSFDGLNTYVVARAARAAGFTVALSGLGADEVFGGYPFFAQLPWLRRTGCAVGCLPATWRRRWQRNGRPRHQAGWAKVADALALAPLGALELYQLANALFRPPALARLLAAWEPVLPWGLPPERTDLEAVSRSPLPFREKLTRLSLRLFLGERCLRDTDAMSMASSLEVRAPFTDHHWLELLLRVPARERTAGSPHKRFEARLFADLLPPEVRRRRKQGFILPLAAWLAAEGGEAVRDLLRDEALVRRAGLSPAATAELWTAYARGLVAWSRVWAVAVFLHWCRREGVWWEG